MLPSNRHTWKGPHGNCCNKGVALGVQLLKKLQPYRTHVILLIYVHLVWTTSATQTSIVNTYTNGDNTLLYHMVMDSDTGTIYIGALNHLYRLDSSLTELENVSTGPKKDNEDCTLPLEENDTHCRTFNGKRVKTEDSDNENKVLVIFKTGGKLITCGTLFQGSCELRMLSKLSNYTSYRSNSRVMVASNSRERSTVAFLGPGPPNEMLDKVLYTGVSYSGADVRLRSEVPAVSSRKLKDGEAFELVEYQDQVWLLGSYVQFLDQDLMQDFIIDYVSGFSVDGFSYFLTVQKERPPSGDGNDDSNYVSKIVQVCQNDRFYNSYTEMTIECGENNIIQSATVAKASRQLASTLHINEGDKVLIAAFAESESNSKTLKKSAAVCMYSFKGIRDLFTSNIRRCYNGEGRTVFYLSKDSCVNRTSRTTIDNNFCGSDDSPGDNRGIEGQAALKYNLRYPLDNILVTSITSSTVNENTILFIGTDDGVILKMLYSSLKSANLYDQVAVEADAAIKQDMIVDKSQKYLYIMTNKNVYKLKTSECERYTNCSSCYQAKDPHCGWCSLKNKCLWRSECERGDMDSTRWVSHTNSEKPRDTCMRVNSVSSDKMDIENAKQISITITNLPVSNNEEYKCVYGANEEVAATVVNREEIQCPPPASFPRIPQNEDHIKTTISIKSVETRQIFISLPFVFYHCMAHTPRNDGEPKQGTGCTGCTSNTGGGQWGCHWCVYDNVCQHEKSACTSQPIVSVQQQCPQVDQPESPKIIMPAGVRRAITLRTRNLPDIKDGLQDYQCVVHVQTPPISVEAERISENELRCKPTAYNIDEKTKDVSIEVVWNGAFYVDDARGTSIQLYNCSSLGDDCGLCLSLNATNPDYGCQWCGSRCKYNSVCTQPPANSCPKPVIKSVSPLAGPREGGTLVTISGSNLGSSDQQIRRITIVGSDCRFIREEYQTSKVVVCETGPMNRELEGSVVLTISGSSGAEQEVAWPMPFSYKDVIINTFKPNEGPVSGGTVIVISGNNLDISNAMPTVKIGNQPCTVFRKSAESVQCRTTRVSSPVELGMLILSLDKAEKKLEITYSYLPDPQITKIEPLTIYSFGGRRITVTGVNLDIVQRPMMFISSQKGNTSNTDCTVRDASRMFCPSPVVQFSQRRKRETAEPDKYYFNFIMDDVQHVRRLQDTLKPNVTVVPDPVYSKFDGIRYYKGDILDLEGRNLDLACTMNEVNVTIGSEQCKVESLSKFRLLCRPPENSPRAAQGRNGPEVKVMVGIKTFILGELQYQKQTSPLPLFAIGILVAGGAIVLFIFVAVVVMYRRRSQAAESQIKKMLIQLDTLESNVRNECKQAFAELQTEVSDLTSDLNMTGIPFWDYRNYTFKVLFPSHSDHPVLHTDIPIHDTLRLGNMERGLQQFNQLINSKSFLLLFIRTLEQQKNFSIRDKAVVASLLMVILQDKMEYATDVLKALLNELIDKSVEKKTAKLLFRRTESVVEKFLTNWLSLCMYDNIKRQTGRPLFILYKAIKHQTEKGPVDAITAEARYSLSEDRLLREKIEPKTLNVQLLVENQEPIQCKMLDCDTITQAKEKALDAIYMNTPHSKRPSVYDVDLVLWGEWRSGRSGHLPLQDEDVTTEMIKGWKRVNTLSHYHVPDGAVMALIPKRNKNDQVRQVHGMVEITSGSLTTLSPIITVEEGTKVWHLVKHDDQANQARAQKVISEIFLTRLLTTKGTIQQYIDELFMTILRVDRSLPPAIKYLFDFLDNAARRHGITESEIVHTWKSNSLPLRFWVNILKNPEFAFDIHKSHVVDSCLSVIAQTFMDSCSTSEHKLGKDSPTNKLLFARDIPKYRKWVDRFYREVQEMAPVTDQEISITMTELSMQYRVDFNITCALKELYRYASSYNFELLESLEDDPSAKKLHLAQKFEQVVAAIDGVPMY